MSTPPSTPAVTVPGGLRLPRVLGVPVFVSPTWFLFAALVVFSYGPALTPGLGAARAYTAAAAFALLLLVSVLLHEIGHCVVARAFGLPVRSITVTFLAGLTEITEPPQTPAREYAVAVVGPMVSLLLAAVGAGVSPLFEPGSLPHLLALATAATNGVVAAFNLLPGLPLDGGRVLRAGLWRLTGDPERATVLAAGAGLVVAVVVVPLLVLVAVPALGLGGPTLVTVLFAVLVAGFVFAGANASLQRARLVQRLPAGLLARLARPATSVPPDLPLAEAVRRAQDTGRSAVVVLDAAGRVAGLVHEEAVRAVPEHRRPWVPVADVARQLGPELVLDPALRGEDLLAVLRTTPASEYLLAGDAQPRVVSTADVVRAATGRRARSRSGAIARFRRRGRSATPRRG
ncbi:MAG TPA: site-2 protease family protein [Mycobacteriales bacterium]|nr:site-2 protease family protein [Mycobacteriales bacterium]